MKKWQKILVAISLLVFVTVACLVSWYYGYKSGRQVNAMTNSMAELVMFDMNLSDQLANTSCEGAKEAINEFLEMLERNKDKEGSLVTKTSYYGDKMLMHIRLARIENKLGNKEQAAKHMEIAKEACAQRRWNNCNVDNMLWFTKRGEKKSPIACLADEKD